MKICLHHFTGFCKSCTPDFDTGHHPNNYDCPMCFPINITTTEVQDEVSRRAVQRDEVRHLSRMPVVSSGGVSSV